MSSITLSPAALFQIIKDIKMGPAVDHAQGRLYGMPSDGEGPIEVTHAFPDYSKKDYVAARPSSDQASNNEEIKKFAKEHMKSVKALNYDVENVGWYTSQNCGRRFNFKDLNAQHNKQKEVPSYFCLVVDLAGSSLSLRAFRIHDEAMDYLDTVNFNKDNIPYINKSMFYDNLLQEYAVSFYLSPLDQEITNQILSSFNLIADVFRLRDPSAFESNVPIVTDAIDDIELNLKTFVHEKKLLKQNRAERERWLKERRQTNQNREKKQLQPLPEEEIDEVHPKRVPGDKVEVMSQLYQFNANSAALREELDEETTKMSALIALSNKTTA